MQRRQRMQKAQDFKECKKTKILTTADNAKIEKNLIKSKGCKKRKICEKCKKCKDCKDAMDANNSKM